MGVALWILDGPIGIALAVLLGFLFIVTGPLVAFLAGQVSVLVLFHEPNALEIVSTEAGLGWLLLASPTLNPKRRPFALPFMLVVGALLGIAIVAWVLYPEFWFLIFAIGVTGVLGSYGIHRLELVQMGLVE